MRISSRVWMAVVAVTGALGAGAAQAHGDDVQWQVSVGTPVPGVVVQRPVPVVVGAPWPGPRHDSQHRHDRYEGHDRYDRYDRHDPHPRHHVRDDHAGPGRWGYQQPTRWDRDGDRIPDRRDRVYNPFWDRDGDGVPNRRDRTPNGGAGWHGR